MAQEGNTLPAFSYGPSTLRVTGEGRHDHSSIIEGRCPSCAGDLERRPDDGWCATCAVGWAYRSTAPGEGVVSLTLEVEVPPIFRWAEDA